ncbi:SIR2-like domain-containing protein [Bradyrhizobium brasilense]|uniref:SIR2-like domain-containing protein n=2 Tax=Bradyrhizobium brasilense TaxID=1419277 RepID=A0A1G6RUT2_9BRAD|nr:SIR2-like domain-containing protein [Bradyrhizobium brasilense]
MGAGLPSWEKLLSDMLTEARGHHLVSDSKAAGYEKIIADPSKYLMAAAGLKDDLGGEFNEFIIKTFIDSKPQPTELHKALVAAQLFQFVLTTNYDTLLEKAYRGTGLEEVPVFSFIDAGEVQRRLSKREFFILKAHGDATRPGNGVVLTEVDYREVLYRRRAYQSLLSTIFTMFSVVFVGASMTDPEIKLLLAYIADSFSPSGGPSHFALMAEEEISDVERERWRKDWKVQIVPVSKADNFVELTEFVKALATLS